MNWRRLTQVKKCAALSGVFSTGVIGLGQAWALYLPGVGEIIRPYLAAFGALVLLPVLLRYLTSFNTFINDIRHPLSGSLMAPMSMALLILL